MRKELRQRRLSLYQQLVAETIVELSFRLGRPFAVIVEQGLLVAALCIDKKGISEAISKLVMFRILREPVNGMYELLPDPSTWQIGARAQSPGHERRSRLAWAELLRAQRMEQLDNGLASEPGLDDALGAVSREGAAQQFRREAASSLSLPLPALAGSEVASSPLDPAVLASARSQMAESLRQTGRWSEEEIVRLVGESPTMVREIANGLLANRQRVSENRQLSVGDSPTEPGGNRLHVSHEVHDMLHVPKVGNGHGGAERRPRSVRTEAEREIWGELERLLPAGDLQTRRGSYGTTWLLRIEDCPQAVRAAVGEVRMMKAQGKIKRSVGGALNDQFHRFRAEIRAASQNCSVN